MTGSEREPGRRLVWCALVVYLAVGFAVFPASGVDDAHITFWPAYTLAEHGSITNYNGERIRTSQNLPELEALLQRLLQIPER